MNESRSRPVCLSVCVSLRRFERRRVDRGARPMVPQRLRRWCRSDSEREQCALRHCVVEWIECICFCATISLVIVRAGW